jgi:hypothetical protein
LETPEGWEKNKDITPLWFLFVPPVALLFGGVIYNLAIEGWDLGWIFLLFVALLVTIAIYTSIANSLRFRGSVTRVFRLMDYERLPILKVGKILEEDLLADSMGARNPKSAGGNMTVYYVLGFHHKALMGVSFETESDEFNVRFHLTPLAAKYTRQVERFAKTKGWDGS